MLITSTVFVDIIILFAIFWIFLYFYFARHFTYWKVRNVPYIKPIPFVGNMWEPITLKTCIAETLSSFYNKYKDEPFFGIFVCNNPCLVPKDPKLIKSILVQDFDYFNDRATPDNSKVDPIGSNMLLFAKNPEWKALRVKVSPIFTPAKIKLLHILVCKCGKQITEYIDGLLKNEEFLVINVKNIFTRYTTNAISTTSFGMDINCFKNEDAKLWKIVCDMMDWNSILKSLSMNCYFIAPICVKIFGLQFFRRDYSEYLKNKFLTIMNHRITTKTTKKDIIDTLIQIKYNKNNDSDIILDDDKILAQAFQFFVAGFETSSSTLNVALFEIAHHQDIQNKLRTEIISVSEKFGGNLTYDALMEMTYLDMCTKEVLRKYPVFPFANRKCVSDYKIPGTDTTINKGVSVFVPILSIHRDSKYYPNPEVFDPERFSKEEIKKRPDFTYLPFGAGQRNCSGARYGLMTVKIGIISIIQHFEIEPTENLPKVITFNPNAFLLSVLGDIPLKFKRI